MDVREIMTSGVTCCRADTNLATAGSLMWQHDCGVLPVVDENMHVTGMITDRDICIALATRNRPASDVTVGSVATGQTFACRIDESVEQVFSTMRDHKVRRVPVVDQEEKLTGIVSIDDLIHLAKDTKGSRNSSVSYSATIETQRVISARPLAIFPKSRKKQETSSEVNGKG